MFGLDRAHDDLRRAPVGKEGVIVPGAASVARHHEAIESRAQDLTTAKPHEADRQTARDTDGLLTRQSPALPGVARQERTEGRSEHDFGRMALAPHDG